MRRRYQRRVVQRLCFAGARTPRGCRGRDRGLGSTVTGNSPVPEFYAWPSASVIGRTARAAHAQAAATSVGWFEWTLFVVALYLLVYTKGGRPLWISAGITVTRDNAGMPVNLLAMLTDIALTRMREGLQQTVLDAMARELPATGVAGILCREVERIAPEVVATFLRVDDDGRLFTLAAPRLPATVTRAPPRLSADRESVARKCSEKVFSLTRGLRYDVTRTSHHRRSCAAVPGSDRYLNAQTSATASIALARLLLPCRRASRDSAR